MLKTALEPPESVEAARPSPARRALALVHRDLDACTACPDMRRPVVHGPAIESRIFLLGQAPGPHEGRFGRPFAWTAGKTLFRWFHDALGISEEALRAKIYMAAVARCFPGKAPGRGDRKPDRDEIARCRPFLEREVLALQPHLVLPVGALAIEQVLGRAAKLDEVVGVRARATYHGVAVDVIALPHPSGVSSWPRVEPGKSKLAAALGLIAAHPAVREAFALPARDTAR